MTAQAVGFELAHARKPQTGQWAPTPPSTSISAPQRAQNLQLLSSATACNHRPVNEQPAPTDEENEQAPVRQPEEEAKQGVDPDQLEDDEDS